MICISYILGVKRSLRIEHGVHLPHGAETGYDCFDDGSFKFDLPNNQDLFSTVKNCVVGV